MISPARPIRVGVAVIALALAATACGGDDDDPATDDASTTVADETSTTVADPEPTTTESVPDAVAEDPTLPESVDPEEGLGDELVFIATLTGAAEVPGPGDDGARGRIEVVSATAGEWCVDMVADGLSAAVAAAHIHMGSAGSAGDVVIDIGAPTATEGDTDRWDDVCVEVDPTLADQVIADPASFYANIHTAAFGDGAIRGQLELSSIFDLELS